MRTVPGDALGDHQVPHDLFLIPRALDVVDESFGEQGALAELGLERLEALGVEEAVERLAGGRRGPQERPEQFGVALDGGEVVERGRQRRRSHGDGHGDGHRPRA
jgi:hypothetical protein